MSGPHICAFTPQSRAGKGVTTWLKEPGVLVGCYVRDKYGVGSFSPCLCASRGRTSISNGWFFPLRPLDDSASSWLSTVADATGESKTDTGLGAPTDRELPLNWDILMKSANESFDAHAVMLSDHDH